MTTVQPSGHSDVGRDLRDCLLRQREALLDLDDAGRELGMDFQADQAVVADEGADAEQRADVEEVDGLRRGAFGDRRADVAQLFADLDFGPLLVEAGQPRRGDDVGVADCLQGIDEQRQAGIEEAELEAAVGDADVAEVGRRRAADRAGRWPLSRRAAKLTPNL